LRFDIGIARQGWYVARIWTQFKGFWTEEEVPRWMGLSFVAVLVVGLIATAWTINRVAESEKFADMQRKTIVAGQILSDLAGTAEYADGPSRNRALRQFAMNHDCTSLRILDQESVVLASIKSEEVGTKSPTAGDAAGVLPRHPESNALEPDGSGRQRYAFRVPVTATASETGLVLEGVGVVRATGGSAITHAQTMLIVLIATAVLWFVYRRMREHFRGMSCIAGNLTRSSSDLVHEIESLRVSDKLGSVAQTWNSLVDLLEGLREETRRSMANQELRAALERNSGGELAEALNSLPQGIVYVGSDQTVQYANAMAYRLLGLHPAGDAARRFGEDVTSEVGQRVAQVLASAAQASGGFETRTEVIETPGDETVYRAQVLPVQKRSEVQCLLMISDISQQRRADKAREDFVSQVTHELRTPLTNIRAYAETLSSGMFDDPKVITECYNVITKETRRLSRLIEDILSISQMEVGNMQLIIDAVDAGALITESVRDVRGLADEKNIDVQVSLPAKLDPIRADRDKLAVVLNNLLGNALKYTPESGSVRVGCKMADGDFVVTVSDTGIGIDPSEHEAIFEKFRRANDPRVQHEAGTGIGLTTAREIVRRHRGDIEVMSTPGQGSTFIVRLPQAKEAAAAVA
jgi:two-component system phosphate regulon sensor histidine kinase PhoR